MKRMEELLMAAEFAKKLGVTCVATHAGFLPENMNDPHYSDVLAALRSLAAAFKNMGISFLFETGQETPITLLRFIEEIGLDNVGYTGNYIIEREISGEHQTKDIKETVDFLKKILR